MKTPMFNRYVLAALAAASVIGLGYSYGIQDDSKQDQSKIVIPVEHTSPANGQLMYGNYCAPCHGNEGRGDGPVASALRTAPTDLTVLARGNNGKYPGSRVAGVLRFGSHHSAHGSREMPIWGPLLGNLDRGKDPVTQLRIANLSRYLKSIQQ